MAFSLVLCPPSSVGGQQEAKSDDEFAPGCSTSASASTNNAAVPARINPAPELASFPLANGPVAEENPVPILQLWQMCPSCCRQTLDQIVITCAKELIETHD